MYYNKLQNRIAIVNIFVIILGFYFDNSKSKFLVLSYFIILFINGNIRRLNYYPKWKYFVRMTVYFLPFLSPFLIFNNNIGIGNRNTFVCCIAALVMGNILQLVKIKQWRFLFSKYTIAASEKYDTSYLLMRCYCLLGSSVCEELYFRVFLLSISDKHRIILVISSIVLFTMIHYINPWAKDMKIREVINFALFSCISISLLFISESIIPSILFHIVFNSYNMMEYITNIIRYHVRKEYYDRILEEDDDINLLI